MVCRTKMIHETEKLFDTVKNHIEEINRRNEVQDPKKIGLHRILIHSRLLI